MTAFEPRSRLLCALALSVSVAVCRSWPAAGAAVATGAACLLLGDGRLGSLAKRLALVNVFLGGVVLTAPLGVPGQALFVLGPLSFSREGLEAGLLMAVKGNALFLTFWGLVRPLSPPALGRALAGLRVPGKLCLMLTLTYRYLDLMRQEWRRLAESAALRGFTPSLGVRTFRVYGLGLALLFVRALDRSACIHEAMLCRGFDGRFRSLGGLGWRAADTALVLAGCLVAAGVSLLDLAATAAPGQAAAAQAAISAAASLDLPGVAAVAPSADAGLPLPTLAATEAA